MTPLLLLISAALAGEISVIGSLVREASLQPGGVTEGVILVRNNGDEPREVKAHLKDYQFSADGSNNYADPGTLPRSNSAWVSVTPNRMILAGQETASVYYRIQAPVEENLSGSYSSLLMVEALPLERVEADKDIRRGAQIQTVIRYGIQLLTDIGPSGPGELSFLASSLERSDGKVSLVIDLGNTGDWRLAPHLWMDVFDHDGRNAGRFEATRRSTLLPGCSARYVLDLSTLPKGQYTALAVADAGPNQVFGSNFTLDAR